MTTTPRPFSGLGFALEPVRGVRTFRYVNRTEKFTTYGDPGQLLGLYYPQVWAEGVNRAQCRRTDTAFNYYASEDYAAYTAGRVDIDHEVLPEQVFRDTPEDTEHLPSCHCGFFAYFDGSNSYYKPDTYGPDLIAGVVEGFGEVLIGSRGFRATQARIVALHIPDRHPARDLILAHYPHVPTFTEFKRMVHEYPEDDGGAREEHRRYLEAAKAAKAKRDAEAAQAAMDDDGGPVI